MSHTVDHLGHGANGFAQADLREHLIFVWDTFPSPAGDVLQAPHGPSGVPIEIIVVRFL